MHDPVDKRDVFISHSSKDAKVAADLVQKLEAVGVSCWIAPRDVKPVGLYADSLYQAIEQAPVFVVLASSAADSSDHVKRELNLAHEMNKPVVHVRLEDFEATGAFCYFMRGTQFYRWYNEPEVVFARIQEEVQYREVVREVDRVLSQLLERVVTTGTITAGSMDLLWQKLAAEQSVPREFLVQALRSHAHVFDFAQTIDGRYELHINPGLTTQMLVHYPITRGVAKRLGAGEVPPPAPPIAER